MKKINYLDSIISPIITEKATNQSDQNKVTFKIIYILFNFFIGVTIKRRIKLFG